MNNSSWLPAPNTTVYDMNMRNWKVCLKLQATCFINDQIRKRLLTQDLKNNCLQFKRSCLTRSCNFVTVNGSLNFSILEQKQAVISWSCLGLKTYWKPFVTVNAGANFSILAVAETLIIYSLFSLKETLSVALGFLIPFSWFFLKTWLLTHILLFWLWIVKFFSPKIWTPAQIPFVITLFQSIVHALVFACWYPVAFVLFCFNLGRVARY